MSLLGIESPKRNMNWSIVYETAIHEDGTYYFPEQLSPEFLEEARKKMGTYLFANQYLNEIFPAEDAKFKKSWIKYFNETPEGCYTFAMIDPAISTEDGADYTGIVVVSVDNDGNWYLRLAERKRMNPTEIVEMCFRLHREFNLQGLGIEIVAYQKALLYMLHEESGRRQMIIPIKEVNIGPMLTKEMRIMALIPRFEFGRIFLRPGMQDLERELLQFPRAKNDDISDALASIESFVVYPSKQKDSDVKPGPHDSRYESWIIKQYASRANSEL